MIVRILGDGQHSVPDDGVQRLNELDDALQAAVERDDAPAFASALEALLAEVRRVGSRLPDDTLTPSDAVLPDTDATLSDVRDLLSNEGLIPD